MHLQQKPNPFDARRTLAAALNAPSKAVFRLRDAFPYSLKAQDAERLPDSEREFRVNESPHLMEYVFPWETIMKIPYDYVLVPSIPTEFRITSTSLRDGYQGLMKFPTVEQMAQIHETESRLSGPDGLIEKTEVFLYSQFDRKVIELMLAQGLEFPRITSWIRAKREDLPLPISLGMEETGILTSCSDFHIYKKLKMGKTQAMNSYIDMINAGFDAGLKRVRIHLEDVTRADIFGFVVPFLRKVAEISENAYKESGGGRHVIVRLCDTMGIGTANEQAALPVGVPKLVYTSIVHGGIPPEHLEWHGHQDLSRGVEAAMAAYRHGCSRINCSIFGIGERVGNIPMELVILNAIENGILPPDIVDFRHGRDLYLKFLEWGIPLPFNLPLFSDKSTATNAGIHADGVNKDRDIYSMCDTENIFGVSPMVLVSNLSGEAGLINWMHRYLRHMGEPDSVLRADKSNPHFRERIKAANTELKSYYAASNRNTPLQDNEVAALLFPHFSRRHLLVFKLNDEPGALQSVAAKLADNQINIGGVHTISRFEEGGKKYVYEMMQVDKGEAGRAREVLHGDGILMGEGEGWNTVFKGKGGDRFISPFDPFFELAIPNVA
ncbi:(R)-citramalate synthase CimA [uncultured archaeon]|nr:(R)-citramalate synthase CimA [uncultured archaeon]